MDKKERQEEEDKWLKRYKKEEKLEEKFDNLVQEWLEQSSYDSWWLDNAIHDFIAYIYLDRGYGINERNSKNR